MKEFNLICSSSILVLFCWFPSDIHSHIPEYSHSQHYEQAEEKYSYHGGGGHGHFYHDPLLHRNPNLHEQALDPAGKYLLQWFVNWEEKRIFFNVSVETLGFIEFGLTKQTDKTKQDLIIGGVFPDGKPYFSDRYVIGGSSHNYNYAPVRDHQQNWILHSAYQSRYHTFLSFSRQFDTCDCHDIQLDSDDTLILLWAYGHSDNLEASYPFATRGEVFQHLKDPDLTPTAVLKRMESSNWNPPFLGSDIKTWSIKNSFKIPKNRTIYMCNIHKINLEKKHHIIGFAFRVNNETAQNLHHAIFFRCIVDNADQVYERFLNSPGEECYSPAMQLGEIPFQSCVELKVGYALGGQPFFIPDSTGIPIGETAPGDEYYLLQIHYDNPSGRTDLVSENQLDIYYTSKLRPYDGGMLMLGHGIPGAPSILLPPKSEDHRIFGLCSKSCSKKMFPPEGLKFVAVLLHAHNVGKKLSLQHFRDNKELEPILQDDSYVNTFQPMRLLYKEVKVLPGDQVNIRCTYDTTAVDGTVVGGYATNQEMCISFIVYYNLLENYPICRSELISPAYLAKYLAGTTNVTWDQSKLEYQATAPPSVAGKVFTEISDMMVDWTVDLRGQLLRDHLIYPQVEMCPSYPEILFLNNNPSFTPPNPNFVTILSKRIPINHRQDVLCKTNNLYQNT